MLARVTSGAVQGIEAIEVRVEVDVAKGLPAISLVGLPESAVREGRERVSAALANSGFPIPPRRITVNLAPADVRKVGSAFDLPIALGLLAATGVIPVERLEGVCAVGELGLDGELRPIRGALPIAIRCGAIGSRELILPATNSEEATLAGGVRISAASTLLDVVRHLRGERILPPPDAVSARPAAVPCSGLDFSDVRGQEHAKRALEIAAAGSHNLLMLGPPGAGKSMLARRLPTILPPLSPDEAIEVTKVHSVAGRLLAGRGLVETRPFRAPHHSISDAGLIGGGGVPRPGEASLAHHGVLFLDELGEFRRPVLESMRQLLEEGVVQIGRARGSVSFPARFILVAAMNPCPCGYHGDARSRCTCPESVIERYRSRISGPLLDRIDIHVEVPALEAAELMRGRSGEASVGIARRVREARARQRERFAKTHPARAPGAPPLGPATANAHMDARQVREHCRLDVAGEVLLRAAIEHLGFSGRAYHRVLKLARTIADLEESEAIAAAHVAEAIQYRALDRRNAPRPRTVA